MSRILIIQNDFTENLGLYESILNEYSDVDLIQAYNCTVKNDFPPQNIFNGFIVGPTPISANNIQDHPYLVNEWKYLDSLIKKAKPILGICCGGQILAKILGAEIKKSPNKEIGIYNIELSQDGLNDPLFQGFPSQFPVFQWHNDMFTIPAEGTILATGKQCPIQSFKYKNTRGVLFHLEIDSTQAIKWIKAYPNELAMIRKTGKQVLEECKNHEREMSHLARMLMVNFLKIVNSP